MKAGDRRGRKHTNEGVRSRASWLPELAALRREQLDGGDMGLDSVEGTGTRVRFTVAPFASKVIDVTRKPPRS
jgi:hypothetical protein